MADGEERIQVMREALWTAGGRPCRRPSVSVTRSGQEVTWSSTWSRGEASGDVTSVPLSVCSRWSGKAAPGSGLSRTRPTCGRQHLDPVQAVGHPAGSARRCGCPDAAIQVVCGVPGLAVSATTRMITSSVVRRCAGG